MNNADRVVIDVDFGTDPGLRETARNILDAQDELTGGPAVVLAWSILFITAFVGALAGAFITLWVAS